VVEKHILFQHTVEWTNVAFLDEYLNLCKALRIKYTSKWEVAMQEKYNLCMANGICELTNLPKDRKNVGCKWAFPHQEGCIGQNCCTVPGRQGWQKIILQKNVE